MGIERSNQLYTRALALIPGGTQTISKRPERYVAEKWPAYWDRAQGSYVWDLDANQYLDYVMALGPIILGYGHPAVDAAITAQLKKGMLSSLQSPLEVDVAEKLVTHVPCAEMVRFFKTGAEATAAVVRIARACTGRDKVISCGYAGWHDWWVAKHCDQGGRGVVNRRGVPDLFETLAFDLEYGDVEGLAALVDRHGDELACILIDTTLVQDGGAFLKETQARCQKAGAVLAFDEVITGFRLGLGGAQARFGVTPDLAAFGKALANGMPLAVVAGKRELMAEAADLWITSTFGGEALSLAAAKATMEELERPGVFDRLMANSQQLEHGLTALTEGRTGVETFGLPSMPGIRFVRGAELDGAAAKTYVEHMLAAGILTRPNYVLFATVALSEIDIERTLEATSNALDAMACAAV